MGSRRKPKNEFGVELLSFCAANGLTYKDVCEGAGVRRTTLVECTMPLRRTRADPQGTQVHGGVQRQEQKMIKEEFSWKESRNF